MITYRYALIFFATSAIYNLSETPYFVCDSFSANPNPNEAQIWQLECEAEAFRVNYWPNAKIVRVSVNIRLEDIQ